MIVVSYGMTFLSLAQVEMSEPNGVMILCSVAEPIFPDCKNLC